MKTKFDDMVRKYRMMKQIIKVVLICLLFISCNGQNTHKNKQYVKDSKKQIENSNKQQFSVDFFDQKYFNGYQISFGDFDISEHPYRYYYNYENDQVQWFAISYVPKDITLHNYWLNYLQGKTNPEEITQSSVIEKIVNKNLSSYNIFAINIPKKFLDVSNGESEEAMLFKNDTEVYFYLYNLSEKKWRFLKKVKTNSPLFGKHNFFSSQFPELFSFNRDSEKLNKKDNSFKAKNNDDLESLSDNFSIEGNWKCLCNKENDSEFIFPNNEGTFFMKDSKGNLIAKLIVGYNEESKTIRYIGAPIVSRDYMYIDWDFGIKSNTPFAVIKKGDNKKIHLEWKGFLNSKTGKIEFHKNPFNQTTNTIILNNCD
ncbi:hypothetical protein [Flavobacterium sp. H122]|uniref:hypothetical protein n=1 Tax=Flavobacterium sp. H122 TaxID=2529860 RepID=UPI0010AB0B10|nr:hypothetical protein [Flavobacterium sp. H122]